jgi:hypothetical protein
MDPFDEFEFKPLTEGLGFHKKKTENKTPSAPIASEPLLKDQGLSLLEEETVDTLRPPLPRKNRASLEITKDTPAQPTAVDEILKTLQKNKRFEFDNAKESLKNTRAQDEYKPTTWNISSAFLDTMLVVAASLLCMIILLAITHVDLMANLTHPDAQGMIYLSTATMVFGVTFIYMLVNRAFLGCTPGEWAFDQRIGRPEDMQKASYSLRVAVRTLLVIATGFILFPILSLLFNKDVVGNLTGASLYKKV